MGEGFGKMKSEKEIKEMYDKLKEIELITNPSTIRFAEWILDIGDKKEIEFWKEIIDGIVDARRRNKK